jgi:hypothetical protein
MSPLEGIPLGQWSGSDATKSLKATIRQFNQQSDRQTQTMLRLTWAMLGLTVVMTVAVGVQIWLTLIQMKWALD